MKKTSLAISIIFSLLVACNNESKNETPASADSSTTETTVISDTTGMAKSWENFMVPGSQHQWLAKMNGVWEAEVTGYMDPSKPEKSKAVNTTTAIMNGLFQEGKFTGIMMGMPFEGRSTMGYDNAKKMFVSTWIDNMSSGFTYLTGTYDSVGKVLNLKGTQTEPMTGKDAGIREVMKIIDDNTYVLEMYGTGMDGKEAKFMEGTFKRKK